ncbi:MAG: primosomal protein N' [Ectothiorhodospira sp.]
MGTDPVLRVAVPTPVHGAFDYRPPKDGPVPPPGARVRVPFGRRSLVGVVLEHATGSAVPGHRLRAVTQVLDTDPLLPAPLLGLLTWAAEYYRHPVGEVVCAALPATLRQGRPALARGTPLYRPTPEAAGALEGLKKAPVQHRLLERLLRAPEGLPPEALRDPEGTDVRRPLTALREKGLVTTGHAPCLPPPSLPPETAPPLNPAQESAVQAMETALGRGYACHLLEGVTGSGKTEVYLRIIQSVLAAGRQALVLVPEIALTPQLLERFRRRLETRIAVLHSSLGERERHCAWLCARNGEAGVLIGTRSAVFAPWRAPGVLIVDEEHDPSLKQQEGLRYHARDLAVLRGHREDVPVLLGSATPALETLANVDRGQYGHLRLPDRAGGAATPRIQVLDMRRQFMDEGLSEGLLARMEQHLAAGGQVLLFLNRRGFAPTLICHACGWVAECPRCDARLTWHAGPGRLRCHHCGHQVPLPPRCPGCGGPLMPRGQGTERIEKALARHFPRYSLVRIDRDSMRRKGALENAFAGVRSGQHRILVGTQMLAKGHDFPDVTLAAILDADQGLFSPDFRAVERLAQTVIQVAGRAGRATRPGEVLIQTHQPDHPLLTLLLRSGYAAFARAALAERREARLPPYAALALLRAEATDPEAPGTFLEAARTHLEAHAAPEVQVWGPAPAPMERRAGRHRAQLLIHAPGRRPLQATLAALPGLADLPQARRVRWSIDVDPMDLN